MPTENTELEKIKIDLSPEFASIIEASPKLELTEAQSYALSFAPFMNKVHELSKALTTMDKLNPTETDAKIARINRLAMVKNRTATGDHKDELKATIVIKDKLIMSLHNVVKSSSELTEAEYLAIEKHAENLEIARKQQLRDERSKELSEYTENPSIYPLGEMQDKDFEELKEGLKLQKQAKAEAERKSIIYQQRKDVVVEYGSLYDSESLDGFIRLTGEMSDLDYEKLLNALEKAKTKLLNEQSEIKRLDELQRKREIEIAPYIQFFTQDSDLRLMPELEYQTLIESLHKAKYDYDLEQENIRKENEKQKKLLEEKEAQLKAEREASEKKQREIEEKAILEREESERKAKAEKEKQDAILAEQQKQNDLKLKAEREAKEKLEKEIQDKKNAELKAENERKALEKKALLAPDKEKLISLSKTFENVQLPELKTNEATEILKNIGILQQKLVKYILEQSEKL